MQLPVYSVNSCGVAISSRILQKASDGGLCWAKKEEEPGEQEEEEGEDKEGAGGQTVAQADKQHNLMSTNFAYRNSEGSEKSWKWVAMYYPDSKLSNVTNSKS